MRIFKFVLVFFMAVSIKIFSAGADEVSQNQSKPIAEMISSVAVSSNKIKITWKIPKSNLQIDSFLIYKSKRPFLNSVLQSDNIAQISANASSYVDTVKDFSEYYYAVMAKLKDGSIYDIVLPSVNATVKGVAVSRAQKEISISQEEIEAKTQKVYPNGKSREIPLPYLDMIKNLEKKPNKLSLQVMQQGKELAGNFKDTKKQKLSPYFFEEDLYTPYGGDDFYLFEILKNYFVKKDYENAVIELQNFLTVNRSEETTNRASFYIAQSQYFLGNYRHALSMFLFTEDTYPILSKKWINSTLDFYSIPKN